MPTIIRLRRTGKKKKPSYRIVVTDSRFPREGRFIEIVGHYNPRTNPGTLVVQEERAKYWLGVGALPSDRVAKLLALKGLCEPPPYRTSTKKAKKEEAPADEKPKQEAKEIPQAAEKGAHSKKEEPAETAQTETKTEEPAS